MHAHCDLSGAGFFYTLRLYKVKAALGPEIWGAPGRQHHHPERMKQPGTGAPTCVPNSPRGMSPTL